MAKAVSSPPVAPRAAPSPAGPSPKPLRRYTSLPVLLDTLLNRRLTLVSYSTWKDANDRRSMEVYQETMHYGFVGAICLTEAPETFHHWQVFAGDTSGVCVQFDRAHFEQVIAATPHCLFAPMRYVKIDEIAKIDASDIHSLPFLKRRGFIDEAELRVVGHAVEPVTALHIDIGPAVLRQVTFSPFMHPELVASARAVIHGIPGWEKLKIIQSRLTDSERWQRALSSFPRRHGVVYGDAPAADTDSEPG
ncbi:hypothetical protein [Sphingomonas sp. ERG5]|uniref:hypothetical protein n=1 Tax=Sphingomonas sp. ERG5 TaxID=1381597 RepID=UPI00054BDB53|nr:hypothetical protein [Sphingomonas sp. ERG5]